MDCPCFVKHMRAKPPWTCACDCHDMRRESLEEPLYTATDLRDMIADLRTELATALAECAAMLEKAQVAMDGVRSTVEFYLKREIESPSNHQEFARESAEKLRNFRTAYAALIPTSYAEALAEHDRKERLEAIKPCGNCNGSGLGPKDPWGKHLACLRCGGVGK